MNLELLLPTQRLKDSYRDHVSEFLQRNEELVPFPLSFNHEDFDAFLKRLEDNRIGQGIPEGFVPNTTFWLVLDDKEVVGVSNLRHSLTESLRREGGHIGYGIRPSRRGCGLGKEILRRTLLEASKGGIDKALITCDKSNTASSGVIIA
ncbi:MAG: GNAT family N-acetyltransferase, partial [Bdellovibrionales bacterium]|nr:GNAT family N-acetyltransferase [Bdellovibrionales bacterium]